MNIKQTSSVNFNYDVTSVPVYVIGDYGIAPWGKNNYFPDPTAKWIWYFDKSNIDALNNDSSPITIQYVYSNTHKNDIKGYLNIIVDNYCDVFLNSNQLKKNNGNTTAENGWNNVNNGWNIFNFTLKPGYNLFEFKIKNAGGPAGLIVSALFDEDINNKILFHTDNTWKFIPIPSKPIESCKLSQIGLITNNDLSFPWGCLSINSSSQYVNIGTTITGMNGLSFGCWFKSNNNANYASIIDFSNNDDKTPNNNIKLYIYDGSLGACVYLMNKTYDIMPKSLTKNINDNKWHHVVWTIQPTQIGSNYSIYVDNNLVSSTQGTYPINTQRTNCYICKSNMTNDVHFNGNISNFVMYQKVLSVNEINSLYLSMINLNDPTLYIYLPFSTNSVLDTILNNYAGKRFTLPTTLSNVKNENWTCAEQNNKWIGIKMNKNMPICMSMDGQNCVELTSQECDNAISNPIVPQNPVICKETQTGWCNNAMKQLTTTQTQLPQIPKSLNSGVPIDTVKPGIVALSALDSNNNKSLNSSVSNNKVEQNIIAQSALDTNNNEKSLNLKTFSNQGKILSLTSMIDVDNLMIGGVFKLRVNLPNMPPYIKGQSFDMNVGVNPNYFYLSVEKLDNNCNIKGVNNNCIQTFADDKKCNIKLLTSYNQLNTFRLVLISSQYVLDPSIPIGKNSDFTIVKINNQLYLKNVQTGYLPSLYSNDMTLPVYGDMEIKSNSNVNDVYFKLNNILCGQETPVKQTTGTSFVKCDIKQDPGLYLMTTKNIGTSSPIRININSDKTISINLLSFNTFGFPTKIYALTSCNFNVQTYAYIEKISNTLGTFMTNMICFEDTQNNTNSKNQLKFDVDLISFPTNFVENNSVFQIN